MACTERKHMASTCCSCLGKEASLPPRPTIGPNSIPFGFGPVASPASQPSLFSCCECSCEASREKHILLEKNQIPDNRQEDSQPQQLMIG